MPKVDGQYLPPPLRRERLPEPRYRCPECLDRRWVERVSPDDGHVTELRPCRHCAPVLARRCREGHFRLDHSCDECSAIRSAALRMSDFDGDGELIGGVPAATSQV